MGVTHFIMIQIAGTNSRNVTKRAQRDARVSGPENCVRNRFEKCRPTFIILAERQPSCIVGTSDLKRVILKEQLGHDGAQCSFYMIRNFIQAFQRKRLQGAHLGSVSEVESGTFCRGCSRTLHS